MTCPKCDGPVYDNRADKASGKRNAKGPDLKCKDKDCGWAQWPEKGARPPAALKNGGGKWTWPALMRTYARSLLVAEKCLQESQARNAGGVAYSHAEVLSAAATIFIAASRDGVQATVKAPPPPPPEPEMTDLDEGADDFPY